MGRVTFETLGKPLKGRLNIVISKNKKLNYAFEDVKMFHSLEDAFVFCKNNNYEKVFIIGGAKIYSLALKSADEMIISIMDFEADGDVFFPDIDNEVWKVESTDKRNEFEIFYYVRRNKNVEKN